MSMLVQNAYVQGSTAGPNSPQHVSFSKNVTVGDTIVVVGIAENDFPVTSVTDSLGNTYQLAIANNSASAQCTAAIYYAVNSFAGPCTVSVKYSSNTFQMVAIYELQPATLDQTASGTVTSATPSCGPVTTTAADFCVCAVVNHLVEANYTAGSGWNLDGYCGPGALGSQSPQTAAVESQQQSSSGSITGTFGGGATGTGNPLVMATFAPGSAPSTNSYLGQVRVVGSAPAGPSNPFLGTVKVVSQAPSGPPNPYLGQVVSVAAPPNGFLGTNPSLGEVTIVSSAPAGLPDPFLGSVIES